MSKKISLVNLNKEILNYIYKLQNQETIQQESF